MIQINIDTNYNFLGPTKPVISKNEIINLKLEINQKVIAIQDDDKWLGTIKFDSSLPEQWQWYIEIES